MKLKIIPYKQMRKKRALPTINITNHTSKQSRTEAIACNTIKPVNQTTDNTNLNPFSTIKATVTSKPLC